jgi:hypothetical protein
MFGVPGLIFHGAEGVGSHFHVSRLFAQKCTINFQYSKLYLLNLDSTFDSDCMCTILSLVISCIDPQDGSIT